MEDSSLSCTRTDAKTIVADVKQEATEQIVSTIGVVYPSSLKLALITTAECLCIFLMALDQTIVATAIPKITDEFKALDDVGWYGSAYLLTSASFQLIFGRLYTLLSIKWTFLTALGIFELGSLICGASPSSNVLILGRAIAGLGCAGIFSGALIIIAHTVPLQKRPIYSSLTGAMYGVASVIGPLLGGVFTDKISWRWCFYINLPIGAIAFAFIFFFFTSPPKRQTAGPLRMIDRLSQFDPLGCILVIPGTCCLLLALQWGGSRFPWNDRRIIVLLVLFLVLISAFVVVQVWMNDSATVPPRIIKQRSILAGVFFAASVMPCFFVLLFFLPIWFQAVTGVTAIQSGIRVLPMIIGVVLATIVSGAAVSTLGYYTPFMLASTTLVSTGSGLLTTLRIDSSPRKWIGFQVLAGFGAGLGIQQPSMAAQNVLDISDVPIGLTAVVFAQQLGSALCVSIGQNIFTNKLITGLKREAPQLDSQIILNIGVTSLKEEIPSDLLEGVLRAYNKALVDVFFVCVVMGSVSIVGSGFMEWRSMKRK